jgi:GT2 family glycosyltransferase
MKAKPIVWIVIPTWNRREDLLACLLSVQSLTYEPKKILVVDNGSTDGTAQAVAERFPEFDRLALESNQGAVSASNIGFRYALERDAAAVLRLDSDTTVAPDFLGYIMEAKDRWPQAGIFVGKVYYMDDPQRIWSTGAQAKKWDLGAIELRRGQMDDPTLDVEGPVDYAWSAGMLLTRDALQATGGFDPDFFVYYEEVDLCLRVSEAGMLIVSVPAARMWHKIGQSSGNAWVAYQWGRSKMLLIRKHSRGIHRLLLVGYAYLHALVRAIFTKQGAGNRGPLKAAIEGLTSGLRVHLE